MRECPKCGYIDPAYWRHVRFRIFTDCCRLEDFRLMFPKLADKIEKEVDIIEHPYIYHLVVKAKIVQRIHVYDSLDGKSWREPEQEKHKSHKYADPNQQKLLEVIP